MSDMIDGVAARTIGDEEVCIPAPCAVTAYIGALTAAGDQEVNARLVVGWNAAGSPIVVGEDGGLRLLDVDEVVTDVAWVTPE